LYLRVDLSDDRCTLVPEGGNEGVDKELQFADVAQDVDPSPEGPKANLASEGKPRCWITTSDDITDGLL
jgi:hypothetical protein